MPTISGWRLTLSDSYPTVFRAAIPAYKLDSFKYE
jgi:hypothetical protein